MSRDVDEGDVDTYKFESVAGIIECRVVSRELSSAQDHYDVYEGDADIDDDEYVGYVLESAIKSVGVSARARAGVCLRQQSTMKANATSTQL